MNTATVQAQYERGTTAQGYEVRTMESDVYSFIKPFLQRHAKWLVGRTSPKWHGIYNLCPLTLLTFQRKEKLRVNSDTDGGTTDDTTVYQIVLRLVASLVVRALNLRLDGRIHKNPKLRRGFPAKKRNVTPNVSWMTSRYGSGMLFFGKRLPAEILFSFISFSFTKYCTCTACMH